MDKGEQRSEIRDQIEQAEVRKRMAERRKNCRCQRAGGERRVHTNIKCQINAKYQVEDGERTEQEMQIGQKEEIGDRIAKVTDQRKKKTRRLTGEKIFFKK